MATYYDGLKDFFKFNEQAPLKSSAQLVYLHLLQLNNRSGNSGRVQVSDRELEHLTSLNKNTVTDAKRTLKNLGLIDFKSNSSKPRQGTTYTLPVFILGQSVGQSIGQSIIQTMGQSVGQPSEIPIIRAHEDLKTKDLKKEKSICHLANARAREDELDNLLEYWEQDLKGGRLSIEHQSEIRLWLEKNGYDWVKSAMKEASDANGRYLNFKLLKGVVVRKMKGGVKSGGSDNADPRAKWQYSD